MTVNHGPFRVDHVGSFLRPSIGIGRSFVVGTSKEVFNPCEDWLSEL